METSQVTAAGSLIDGDADEDALTRSRAWEWQHWVTRWQLLRQVRSQRRHRALSINGGRLAGAATAVALASFFAAASWQTTRFQLEAETSAHGHLAFVESRLNVVDVEMTRLQRRVPGDLVGCPPAVVGELVAASIASEGVRRFLVRSPADDLACGPEGWGRLPPEALARAGTRALSLTTDIDAHLWAIRKAPGGASWFAALDNRVFDLHPDDVRPGRDGPSLSLHSPQGQLLTRQRRPFGTAGASLLPDAVALARSDRHGVVVQALVPGAAVEASAWRHGLAAAALALTVLAGAAAAVWQRALLRVRLVNRIATGLRKRQFEPYVQPIVDLSSGRCLGGEILMRWEHPERGTVPPGEFIDAAERSGLIAGMSDLVMSRAAHRLATIAQAYPETVFTFNVAPSQLRDRRFSDRLGELFGPQTLPQRQVMLELTEREAVDPRSLRAMQALRKAGWRIAIDDFGTGQSSLAALEKLPIDRIKIDISFVRGIDARAERRPVLDAIVKLGHELGVRLIAEGVETQAQWDYLAARGVQAAQGYLIARPMPLKDFTAWLAQRTAGLPETGPGSAEGASPDRLDAETERLWQRLRAPGTLDVRDRTFRLKTYRHCFVGREAVDWLVRHERMERPQAVRACRRLLALGLVRHVLDEHDFEDGELYYRMADLPAQTYGATPACAEFSTHIRGIDGPLARDHSRGWLTHRQCCTGREIVDWTVAAYRVSRETATAWATDLMRQGALRHVFDDKPFSDGNALFRLH